MGHVLFNEVFHEKKVFVFFAHYYVLDANLGGGHGALQAPLTDQ